MFKNNIDTMTVKDMISSQGYSHEFYEVATEDGYVNILDRVVRKEAFNVVYFQHGIFDSSWSWINHGTGESMAFAAHDNGFDVFLGNYRGLYPRKVTPEREK